MNRQNAITIVSKVATVISLAVSGISASGIFAPTSSSAATVNFKSGSTTAVTRISGVSITNGVGQKNIYDVTFVYARFGELPLTSILFLGDEIGGLNAASALTSVLGASTATQIYTQFYRTVDPFGLDEILKPSFSIPVVLTSPRPIPSEGPSLSVQAVGYGIPANSNGDWGFYNTSCYFLYCGGGEKWDIRMYASFTPASPQPPIPDPDPAPVPEPSNILGLSLLGLGLAATKMKGVLSKKAKSPTDNSQTTDS